MTDHKSSSHSSQGLDLRPVESPSIQRQAEGISHLPERPPVGNARFLLLRVSQKGRVELLIREPGLPVGTIGLGIRFSGDGPELVGSGDPLSFSDTYTIDEVRGKAKDAMGGRGDELRSQFPFVPSVEGSERALQTVVDRFVIALESWRGIKRDFFIPELRLREPLLGGEPRRPSLGVDTDLQLLPKASRKSEASEEQDDTSREFEFNGPTIDVELGLPPRKFDLGVPDLEFPTVGDRQGDSDFDSDLDPTRVLSRLDKDLEFESVSGTALVGAQSPEAEFLVAGPLTAVDVEEVKDRFGIPNRQPGCEERYVIYSNDGNLPNFGSGSDHWLTAFLQFGCRWNPEGRGYTDAAYVMEMFTPPGMLPEGAPRDATQQYAVPYDLWMGLIYATFEYRIASVNDYDLNVTWHVGANSLDAGKVIQDLVHEYVSDSPFFPWPSGIEPYGGVGAGFQRRQSVFDSAILRGEIVFGGDALLSTHRSHGELSATLELHTGEWSWLGTNWRLKGGVGGSGRLFARYGDQREGTVAGAEYDIETRIGLDIGNFGVEVFGNALMSTDPAAQGLEDFASTSDYTSPLFLPGFLAPDGHFGTGGFQLTYRRRF
ncbi:hypothetical protein [Natronorarus salvus]|uniref:hypothetical protein n=1 Tax=Natronorarus salvus TaxID=3117733 RepID=UPI002F26B97C